MSDTHLFKKIDPAVKVSSMDGYRVITPPARSATAPATTAPAVAAATPPRRSNVPPARAGVVRPTAPARRAPVAPIRVGQPGGTSHVPLSKPPINLPMQGGGGAVIITPRRHPQGAPAHVAGPAPVVGLVVPATGPAVLEALPAMAELIKPEAPISVKQAHLLLNVLDDAMTRRGSDISEETMIEARGAFEALGKIARGD